MVPHTFESVTAAIKATYTNPQGNSPLDYTLVWMVRICPFLQKDCNLFEMYL